MAVDPVFEGIISMSVQDNTPAQMDALISRFQAKMAELGNLPGAQVGQQVFASVEGGASATLTVIDQLKLAMSEMNAAGRGMLASGAAGDSPQVVAMREMVAGTDAVIAALKRLMLVQQEEQLTAFQTAKVQAEASATAVGPVTGATARAAAQAEREAADAAIIASTRPGPGQIAGIRVAGTGQVPAFGMTGGAGLNAVNAQIEATTGVGEGTPLKEAAARVVKAQADLAVAINREFLTIEQRTSALAGGIANIVAADRRLVAAEGSAAAAAEKAAASSAVVAPKLSGIDPDAPAKIQQLQLDTAIAVAKEQTLLAVKNGTVTEVELAQARIRTLAVEERLAAAMEKQAAEASGTGGGAGGMGALQMLKYYAFYQVFQEGSKLLGDVKRATEEYSLAVNQLSIALGGNQDRAQTLAATYSTIGQNLATAPTIAVDAATKYTRFFQDTSGVSGDIGARLGSTVNLLEGAKAGGAFGDPAARAIANDKTLGELAAIAKNYDLGAQGAADLYDAATVIAQKYGLGESQGGKLTSGAAQIADLFKESGFTPEQGLALTGSVMQYTGNTSEMAAGDLKRFLGRQGSDTFKNIFAEFQIDQNQSLHDEFVDLGAKWKGLSDTQRGQITSAFGGGRAGAAVVAAITDLPSQTAVAAKGADSIGIAAEQAQLRLGTFAGKLEQISADWSTLATHLGTSGLGLVFGDALALVDPLLRGVDALVSGFALLPGYVKQFLEVLALASVAGRVFGGSFGLEGVTGMLTKVGGIGKGAAEDSALTGATNAEVAAQARLTEATALATEALVAQAAAQGADAAATELDTVAAGENAVAQGANAAAQGAAAAETGVVGIGTRLGALGTAAGGAAIALVPIVAAIAAIAAIGDVNKSAGIDKTQVGSNIDARKALYAAGLAEAGFGGPGLGSGEDPVKLREAAKTARAQAAALHAENDSPTFINRFNNTLGFVFGDEQDPNKIPTSNLNAESAPERIAAARQFEVMARDAEAKAKAIEERRAAAPGGGGAAQNFGSDYTDVDRGIKHLATLHASVSTSMKILRDELAHIPASSFAALLTPQPGHKGVGDEIQRLTTQIGHSNNPIQNEADLGKISSYTAELAKRAAGTDQQDAATAFYDTALKAYHQSILSNVKAKVDSIHAMQSNNASSQAQIRGTVTAALTEFARTGDVNSVVALLAGVNKAFLNKFNAGIAAERAVLEQQAAGLRAAEAAATAALTSEVPGNYNQRQIDAINTRHAAGVNAAATTRDATIAATIAAATPLAAPSGGDFTWPKAAKDKAATGPTAAQIEEARLAAQEIPGDPMSAAITNLRVAQYKMSEPKNQVEYWQALKALHEAQYAYSMAQQSAANDATQLGEDLTNPLVVAREKVREAQRQLALDAGRGALSDVTNKDKLALKQAVSAAEKTAFDQKFSDESTNYNLQRISLSAYLSYLNAQHNYLTSVHSKTRQQVDELNQVDQALQGLANQLQGQFNLGQIKVPSPYEARRIEAGGGTTSVQITINGTDIPAVKAILTQYLGQGVMSTAGSSARRV